MSDTQPKRDDKMFFGAQTPFRPQWALNILKKATGMLIYGTAKPLLYFEFYSKLSFVRGE